MKRSWISRMMASVPTLPVTFDLQNVYRKKVSVDDLLQPFSEAIDELERRRKDPRLMTAVEEYLGGDVPAYFNDGPVLYMARHLATPNFETLRFLSLAGCWGMKTVIGQDTEDLFVSQNPLKKALGKLPVCTGIHQKEGKLSEQYHNALVIDFNSSNGKPFRDVKTFWGENLADFHGSLLERFSTSPLQIEDDAAWITRMHRGDLLQHYKKFLALFVVHGILFEDYLVEDKHEGKFVAEVLRPAVRFIHKKFKLRPLITKLTPSSMETQQFWMSYPKEVLEVVSDKMKGMTTP